MEYRKKNLFRFKKRGCIGVIIFLIFAQKKLNYCVKAYLDRDSLTVLFVNYKNIYLNLNNING
jgi:hypothetical protein